jgi:hypothetical protein
VPQHCGSHGQNGTGVSGENNDGCSRAEQLSGGREADGVRRGGGQPVQAVFLHGGASVRDEPEQRLGDIQQGQNGDDGADLVADDRADADPERCGQRAPTVRAGLVSWA